VWFVAWLGWELKFGLVGGWWYTLYLRAPRQLGEMDISLEEQEKYQARQSNLNDALPIAMVLQQAICGLTISSVRH
jgi:hypothetical protein